MGEDLPVLIAAVTAERARELEEASRVGRDVWVPLEREPTQGGPHVLEIYTAESDAPIRLLAEPLGPRSEHGSAIRLRPWKNVRTSIAGGRFELLSLIGEGSIGSVYRARHTGLKNMVAVKVLHEAFQRDTEFCRRFYAEALAMSRLNHANVINILDFGQEPDGLLYIVMSYLAGSTMREVQHRSRSLDISRVVGWMLQVGAGLGHAHARGLIHRDVKPDNVMIVTNEDDDGKSVETIKILDFGFAVPPSVSGELAQRLAGTPVYMSPEQCRGEELDERSDIYACGIMMYELALASGSVPFLSNDSLALRQMHVTMPPPLISAKRPDIDPRYERIVQRALSKRREDRQSSMTELRAELKALLVPELAARSARVQEPATPEPPPSSRLPLASQDDDWLERGSGYVIDATTPSRALADKLAKDASTWLGELARERKPREVLRMVEELDGAVRILAERADAMALSRVSAVVAGLGESVRDEAARSALAAVTRLFADPDLLIPVATSFLLRETGQANPQREAAATLITQARISGAVALHEARTKLADPRVPRASTQHGRVAFVTTMKSLGASARPVLRAALERNYEQAISGQHRGPTELVEDVLLSIPKGDDERAGDLVVKFAGSNVGSVARAAARALPRVWGFRARPVLLSLIQHRDDDVCLAAIVGLHELDALDLDAVARIAAQVDAGRVRTQQIKNVFATALHSATASAHAEALRVLARMPR